jgi:hypothetical protein
MCLFPAGDEVSCVFRMRRCSHQLEPDHSPSPNARNHSLSVRDPNSLRLRLPLLSVRFFVMTSCHAAEELSLRGPFFAWPTLFARFFETWVNGSGKSVVEKCYRPAELHLLMTFCTAACTVCMILAVE